MSLNDIYLGPVGDEVLLTPYGRKFSESDQEIAREDRTASGRKVKDIVAVKKAFTLQYELITDADLLAIKYLYDLQQELNLQITRPGGGVDEYTVLLKPFGRERVVAIGAGLWGNVSIEMEEV